MGQNNRVAPKCIRWRSGYISKMKQTRCGVNSKKRQKKAIIYTAKVSLLQRCGDETGTEGKPDHGK